MDSRHRNHWRFFPAVIFRAVIFLAVVFPALTVFAGPAIPAQGRPAAFQLITFQPTDSIPSPEAFVNAVFRTVVDSSSTQYYLVAGSDTCRFLKYDYDEWMKYDLLESVPFTTLNELAQKVYLDPKPWFWWQDRLQGAICISAQQADSILDAASAAGAAGQPRRPGRARRTGRIGRIGRAGRIGRSGKQASSRPSTPSASAGFVYSFSRPYFTDDGQYAVIDLNLICGARCGRGTTFLFRRTAGGWKRIGRHVNWSS